MAKTYGKRLVPEYLITKLEELEPGGGDYTAGTGIEISDENVISVDTDTIETKSNASSTYVSKASLTDGAIQKLVVSGTASFDNSENNYKVTLTAGPELPDGKFTSTELTPTKVKIAADDNEDVSPHISNIEVTYSGVDITTPILKYNNVEVATVNDVPTTATSTSTVTPTTETLTFTYSDNTTGTITFITAATVSTTTTLS